uniref:Uncharacterized protein n=1 Tax=Lactuca sativa TaxID=4236 RepID=A0A9R1XHT9_LACSA|nr:hypothetical protein LSAT_V11C400201750 [Lactuca sativa]
MSPPSFPPLAFSVRFPLTLHTFGSLHLAITCVSSFKVTEGHETEVEEATGFSMFSSTQSHHPLPAGYLPPTNVILSVFTTFVLLKMDSTIDQCSTSIVYTRLSKIDLRSHHFSKTKQRRPGSSNKLKRTV